MKTSEVDSVECGVSLAETSQGKKEWKKQAALAITIVKH